ncbi:MAG TPA: GNAT family N-acetyltransferase [Bacteroidales bacterium]|nr:GNAT family N-acetyltransferase [Bacteroidales bacterium]HPS74783.1 GNAT family N-acetyltransferase [Bacteroidales bacterium]
MEPIIEPVDPQLLEEELTDQKFVRNTNNGANKIYLFSAHDSPNLMREVGRLREITFRDAGGGTGLSVDIDEFDTMAVPFHQLIVWDPAAKEIVGGYRFIHGKDLPFDADGNLKSATGELFEFSPRFLRDYLSESIELGRSFVQPNYQPTYNFRKGMYSLDNIWDGLGAMIIDNPDVNFFFGKMTMYPQFNRTARDIILRFLQMYFPDHENLLRPLFPVSIETSEEILANVFTAATYEENYRILVQTVRKYNENVPPLVNAYMNLSPTMRTFGTSINAGFGDVEETGILINIPDIYLKKKERHLKTYIERLSSLRNIKWRRKKFPPFSSDPSTLHG